MQNPLTSMVHELSSGIWEGGVIFAGAGISRDPPASMPLANDVKRAVLNELCEVDALTNFVKHRQKRINSRLDAMMMEALFQVLENRLHSHALTFLDCFAGGEPNHNHVFLARLLASGTVTHLVTTNFDCLIEDALRAEGWTAGRDYSVVAGSTGRAPRNRPVILKLHGTISDKNTIISVLDQVGKGLAPPMRQSLTRLLAKHPFIFMGWSNDDVDITPVLKAGRSRFVWMRHRPGSLARITGNGVMQAESRGVAELLRAHNGVIFDCDYTEMERAVLRELGISANGLDSEATGQHSKTRAIPAPRIELPLKMLLMADLARTFGLHGDAAWLYKLSVEAHSESLSYRYAEAEENIGEICREQGDLKGARERFRSALNAYQSLGARKRAAEVWSSLGDAYVMGHQWKRAKRCFLKSLDESERCRSDILVFRACGNLGMLCVEVADYDGATTYLKRSIRLADRCGDYHGKAFAYGNLATVHQRRGNLRWAKYYAEKALAIHERCQYAYGISVALQNLGTIHNSRGEHAAALRCHESALRVKTELGDERGRAEVLNNLGYAYLLMGNRETAREVLTRAVVVKNIVSKNDLREVLPQSVA